MRELCPEVYQDGLLITYWDSGEANNNTSVHRGEGRALFVDAHSEPLTRVMPYDGQNWSFAPWVGSVSVYDATFGLEPTDPIRLPFTGTLPSKAGSPAGTPNRVMQFETEYPSLSANPVLNDMLSYWSASRPDSSVIVPRTGTVIRVISTSARNSFMHIQVNPAGE